MSKGKDIFISYRRDGGEFLASLLYQRLNSDGYSVFLDVESLRSGKFNEQLYQVIEACTDFLLILPPKGLDRCVHPDDWVRLEIERAVDLGKNIVPVMMRGFAWPETLPEKLRDLPLANGVTADTELFDGVLLRLEKKLLLSEAQGETEEKVPLSQQLRDGWGGKNSGGKVSPVLRAITEKKETNFIQEFEKRNAEQNQNYANTADSEIPEADYGLGLHFSIVDPENCNTIIYRLIERYDEKRLLRYMEPDRLIRSSEQLDRLFKRTYYIPSEDIQGNFLSLHFITFKDCGKTVELYMNTGALSGWNIKITKKPVLAGTVEKPTQSTTGCYLGNLTDGQKEQFENGYGPESYYEENMGPVDGVFIDPITLEEVRREVFFDEKKNSFAARVKLKTGYPYCAFYIDMESGTNSGTVPLTNHEIGSAYRTGSHGFPKDLMKAGEYLEKDGSADALYQIGLMFRDEEEIRDPQIAASYFQRAAESGSKETREILGSCP